jgi:lipocalin
MLQLFSCKPVQNLPTVEVVDLTKYSGTWYEIARLPNSFEKGLECITATYTLKGNGKIEVLNKGFYIKDKTKFSKAKGTAWIPDANYQGRLKVSFFWPFAGDYYIIALDENYNYALVGSPTRNYLWILSRTKVLDKVIIDDLLNIAKQNGFDTSEMIYVIQDCN